MKTLWVVSEGSPGHDSQSEGLAGAIAELVPVRVVRVRGRWTAAGWVRPMAIAAMGRRGRPLPGPLLRRVAEVHPPEDAPAPDWVLASGGKSVCCARTLAARHAAKLVYLGEQKRFPNGWFDVIVSPVPGDPRPNAIEAELLPTPISPGVAEAAAARVTRPSGRLWAMIVGGASRSHRFTDADWEDLARGMNTLASRHGIRWLLTTSRRTGAQPEDLLSHRVAPSALADAVWWSRAPRRVLHAFLGMAEYAFVTQDSVTMVTEAVAAGRPTVAVRPRDTRFARSSFLPAYFDRLQRRRRLERITAGELGGWAPDPARFTPLTEPGLPALAQAVLSRLAGQPAGPAIAHDS